MLASLHRVQPEQAGRIVLVTSTADPVAVSATGIPLPAWRVSVMGPPIMIDDEGVAPSSRPSSACTPYAGCRCPARKMSLAQAQRDADAAIEALRAWLAAHPTDEHELDAEIKAGAREAIARHRAPAVLLPIGW